MNTAMGKVDRLFNQKGAEMIEFENEAIKAGAKAQDASKRVAEARKRHGKPFAWETGSAWKPRETPLLQEWLSQRTREKAQ